MEDNRKGQRTLQRLFESNRLEEQLWAMAYEELWPVIRRSGKKSNESRPRGRAARTEVPVARRA
jgi:hypothetical protein